MARLPRLLVPGYPVHLVVRGNDRQDIFRSEGDRVFFHRCLVEKTTQHDVRIHAYVFMTNHVHLLASDEEPGALGKVIQAMGRRYVSYFNYLYGRSGTLWEGRFRSCLIQTDRYLLACHRYIEMNPVRAGLVRSPAEYRWSSFQANCWGKRDDLVTAHPIYDALGATHAARQAAYGRLFEKPIADDDQAIRDSLRRGWALGDRDFCLTVEGMSGRRAAPLAPGRPRKNPRIN